MNEKDIGDRMRNPHAQFNGVRGGVVHNAIDQRQIRVVDVPFSSVTWQALQRELDLQKRIRELEAEKMELVARNQALRTRPDLPADHLPQRLEILKVLDDRNAKILQLELENEVLREEAEKAPNLDVDNSEAACRKSTPFMMGMGMMYIGAVGILIAIVFGRFSYVAMEALNEAKGRIETLEGVVRQSTSFVRDIASQADIHGATREEVASWIDEMERIGLATDDEIDAMIDRENMEDARSEIDRVRMSVDTILRPLSGRENHETKGHK